LQKHVYAIESPAEQSRAEQSRAEQRVGWRGMPWKTTLAYKILKFYKIEFRVEVTDNNKPTSSQ
jgi:hypothetical protein